MAVPFAKMHAAVVSERRDREVRELLNKFAKAIVGKAAYRLMRDYDQRMLNLSINDAGDALLSCMEENPLNADLYVDIANPVSIITVLRGDLQKNTLRNIFLHLAKSVGNQREAIVIFKVKHLGAWVAYNTADPYPSSLPRIVIPSTAKNQNSVILMPMNNYTKLWQAKRGETEDAVK